MFCVELTYDTDPYTGMRAVIAGWGLPNVTALGTNTVMKQISVNIFTPKECKDTFGRRMVSTKRQMCAAWFNATEDSCAV